MYGKVQIGYNWSKLNLNDLNISQLCLIALNGFSLFETCHNVF